MNKITSAVAVLVAGLFLAGIFAVPANAAADSSSTWNVGDKWAMGKEVDLGTNITANLTELNQMLKASTNMTIDELNVDSKVGAYVLFEVTGETTTTYTVAAKMAVKFATAASIEVTGELPVAGTYSTYQNPFSSASMVEKERKTVSLDIDQKLGIVVASTAIIEKSTMSITNMTWSLSGALSVEVDGKNIPDINTTGTSQVISYKNYDLGFSLVAGVDLFMDFSPALDLYQLPVEQGQTWYTNETQVTASGSVNGYLDAHGLTAEQKKDIFTEDLKNATGATDFPIRFEKLNSTDSEITNGQFGPYTGDVPSIKMRCLDGNMTRTVDGEVREYLIIQVNDGPNMLYSSGLNFMAGMYADMDMEDMPVELPAEAGFLSGLMGEKFQMEPMSVEAASKNIESIESYTNKMTGAAGGSSIADFFFKAPFLGIFFVAIAALSVIIIVFVARKPRTL
ncbi:MAG: hypothetical protein ISF22_05955 [Methanomassiliicoccus sp.]|nr:hypothetical protein [Methanomassiliicoccus sp.]